MYLLVNNFRFCFCELINHQVRKCLMLANILVIQYEVLVSVDMSTSPGHTKYIIHFIPHIPFACVSMYTLASTPAHCTGEMAVLLLLWA